MKRFLYFFVGLYYYLNSSFKMLLALYQRYKDQFKEQQQ